MNHDLSARARRQSCIRRLSSALSVSDSFANPQAKLVTTVDGQ
ncbi:hypothetical protein [Bradyrhizobium stylosanthis]|uniref:Uncharacterized protein n=1 Tax=Bradyrhizobium stylosanthis TaxID=1803665 RepID=A0A560E4A5_9BRAD|nr:hypothetical protein [Bradyrhizobium stylosanthis]TWB04187.1 hypothetical protein FBZ96_102662 [Bradyrhizobium stylosanthis]